jgi:protein ImuA
MSLHKLHNQKPRNSDASHWDSIGCGDNDPREICCCTCIPVMPATLPARQALVATLRREVARLESTRPPEDEQPISTGSRALDRLLPAGGLRQGTLVEYLSSGGGCGAGTLALAAAREACQGGRALIVVGTLRVPSFESKSSTPGNGTPTRRAGAPVPTTFYPPAAAAWGIDLSRLVILRPAKEADAVWALDQALRCRGVGAVFAECDRLDVRDFRRLQLAAEAGGTLGLLLRPDRLRGQPTWADVRLEVRRSFRPSSFVLHPSPAWRLHVELLRCRGAAGGQSVVLELDETAGIWREATHDAPHPLPVAAELADPTPAWRA